MQASRTGFGDFAGAAFAAIQAIFVLAVFLPAIIYFFNSEFVEYRLIEHYGPASRYIVVLALVMLGACIPARTRPLASAIFTFIVIYVVVAAVFLPSWVPALDGAEEFASLLDRASVTSHAALIALAIAAVVVIRKRRTLAAAIGQAMALVAVGFVVYAIFSDKPRIDQAAAEVPGDETGRVFAYSTQQNVVIVLMDEFQGDVFAELLQDNDKLKQEFEGFTYFPNITGVSPQTLVALPAIFSGHMYQGGDIKAFYENAYRDSLFTDARTAGFTTTLYGSNYFGCPAERCVNRGAILKGLETSKLASYFTLIDSGLMRIVPTSLQPHIHHDGLGLLKRLTPSHHTIDSLRGLEQVARRARVTDVGPQFKFIHLMNTHQPVNIDADCELSSGLKATRDNYKVQANCGLERFVELLRFLRTSDIYDRTAVVLLSDHGATLKAPSQPEALGGQVKLHSGRAGRFNPLLVVKPVGQKGALRISQAPVSLLDVRATVCDAARICDPQVVGVSAFELPENASRERMFVDYRVWARDIVARNGLKPEEMRVFRINGSVRDLDSAKDGNGEPIN